MTEDTTMVRVPTKIVDEYRNSHPELAGLTYTAVVEVMLRKALENRGETKP